MLLLAFCAALGFAAGSPLQYNSVANSIKLDIPFHITMAYYINLDSRTDRRERMETVLNVTGLPYERVPAIRIDSIESIRNDPAFHTYKGVIPSQEEIETRSPTRMTFVLACLVSHTTVYEHINQDFGGNNDAVFLVLEDDVQFSPDWLARLQSEFKNIPTDWDIVRIGFWGKFRESDRVGTTNVFRATAPFEVKTEAESTFYYGGNHAALVRRRTIPTLLSYLKSPPLNDIDLKLTTCCETIKSYAINTDLIRIELAVAADSDHPTHLANLVPDPIAPWVDLTPVKPDLPSPETPTSLKPEIRKI